MCSIYSHFSILRSQLHFAWFSPPHVMNGDNIIPHRHGHYKITQLYAQIHKRHPISCPPRWAIECHMQGWGQFRNWNWNWLQFQFQFRNWNWNWNFKSWNWNWNWNCKMELTGIEMELKIPFQFHHQFFLHFPYFLLLMAHIDVMKIAGVFFKERICFKNSYCKKISVIQL